MSNENRICITLRMTEKEKELLQSRAAQSNLSLNKYIISALHGETDNGAKAGFCRALAMLACVIDKLPDVKKKDKLKRMCGEIWQYLK